MAGQEKQRSGAPAYGLLAGVGLEIAAGAVAFLTDLPVAALVLGMVGLVCLGVAGEAMQAR